ncbi:hypothetical protein POL68_17525 [Stigmatella sp. ncwal1]|uniref:Lipoprotein n=1 Tax=Stigmatella ashevillensis TaxID=2995309 RepID=A0ABT5D9C7_9BACT|nr:hypothetical protein [Stigmatella ashevillena]MDC0710280.1 hypothetical protein [Stigmatella ashevillena]
MDSGTKLLRAVVLMSTGLALTACGGATTEEESAAMEAETLTTSEADLSSCAGWSEWYFSGPGYCGTHSTCGFTWSCDYLLHGGEGESKATSGDMEKLAYYCEDGSLAYKIYNPATFDTQESYRTCFDQYGNYTHTEYQYRYAKSACGC